MEQNTTKNSNHIPELLAPAGSFEVCRAVIKAGADAVYLGGSRFGARAYADNLSADELTEAIDYAHLFGRKIYLTVNTLLKQSEMELLYEYLLPYYERGLDAVIVQDFGVMQFIRTYFPEIPIHISTQMSIAGVCGAVHLKNLGAARIVTARELSLSEIAQIRRQADIQIECFVHGALCYCYSGQCLLSSMLGGRSGNRGRCAQPCRLPYTVLDARRQPLSKAECYPLSLKDLCTIDQIPQLIAAGIDSFKIEGRMKSAQYAAGVTSIYRNYIDQYMESGSSRVRRQDYDRLLDTGNRSGFTKGYYRQHNGADMVTLKCPSYEKGEGLEPVSADLKLPVRAEASFHAGQPAKLMVSYKNVSVKVQHGMTEAAKKQPLSTETIKTQLSKTGNTPFQIESAVIQMDEPVFLPKQALNQLRRSALEALTAQILKPYVRSACQDPDTKSSAHAAQSSADAQSGKYAHVFLRADSMAAREPLAVPKSSAQIHAPAALKSEAATDTSSVRFTAAVEEEYQLEAVLSHDLISRIYLDSSMYKHSHFAAQLKEHVSRIKACGAEAYFILPHVFRQYTAQFYKEHWDAMVQAGIDGWLAKNQDELGFLKEQSADQECCILDHSLYAYSDSTRAYFGADGWRHDTIPLELNKKEMLARNNKTSELVIYGHMPLMVSAQCIRQTIGKCTRTRGLCYLKDRCQKEFPVKNNCQECYNVLYNAQPLSLIQLSSELSRLHAAAYRLHFTIEPVQKIHQIIDSCEQSFLKHTVTDLTDIIGAYTNDHYKRGVE